MKSLPGEVVSVVKFSDKERDFPAWMALFIEGVHKLRCPITWKAMSLHASLDVNDSRLRDLHEGAGATKEDYAHTLHRL